MGNIKHVVGISGGKDSVSMAIRLKELNPTINFEYVITPTGDELPEMEEHWEKLQGILGTFKSLGDLDIFQLMDREQMLPNYMARFCPRVLKIEPFVDYMDSLPPDSVLYVGLRADEEGRLGILRDNSKFRISYPLREWGWDINAVLGYLQDKGIIIPERTDCGMCFFQRLPEWKQLLEKHPARFEKYVQIEKKFGHTFRSNGRDTWPAALYDLRAEFLSGRKLRNSKPRGTKKCRFCSM